MDKLQFEAATIAALQQNVHGLEPAKGEYSLAYATNVGNTVLILGGVLQNDGSPAVIAFFRPAESPDMHLYGPYAPEDVLAATADGHAFTFPATETGGPGFSVAVTDARVYLNGLVAAPLAGNEDTKGQFPTFPHLGVTAGMQSFLEAHPLGQA